jgi:hypothetical protein
MARSGIYVDDIVYRCAVAVVPGHCGVGGEVWSAIVVKICAIFALGVVDDVGGSMSNMMFQDTLYGSSVVLESYEMFGDLWGICCG